MNSNLVELTFDHTHLHNALSALDEQQVDSLPFGVIGFHRDYLVTAYNQFESQATGLSRDYVLGKHVFTQIAQCMNNFLVAQRFEDAWTQKTALDVTLDYVLTWRMKPTRVKLRLLCTELDDQAYIVLSIRSALQT